MSEKVLGFIRVWRPTISFRHQAIHEALVITPNRVFVARLGEMPQSGWTGGSYDADIGGLVSAVLDGLLVSSEQDKAKKKIRKSEESLNIGPEEFLKADKNNYAIPNTAIQKIEIKSRMRFHITTTKKKHKWYLSPKKVEWTKTSIHEDIENIENILRPIFGDKLSVKK